MSDERPWALGEIPKIDEAALRRRLAAWAPMKRLRRLEGGTNPGEVVELRGGAKAVYREYVGGRRAWATECGVCGELADDVLAPQLLDQGEDHDAEDRIVWWSLVKFVDGNSERRPDLQDVAEAMARVALARRFEAPALLGEKLCAQKSWASHCEELEGFVSWALGQAVVAGRLGDVGSDRVRARVRRGQEALREMGSAAYLMHGDLKDAHFVGRAKGGTWAWWLVDWEMGRAGHPLIELGRWSTSRALSRWRDEGAEVLDALRELMPEAVGAHAWEVVEIYRLQTLLGTLRAGAHRDEALTWAFRALEDLGP